MAPETTLKAFWKRFQSTNQCNWKSIRHLRCRNVLSINSFVLCVLKTYLYKLQFWLFLKPFSYQFKNILYVSLLKSFKTENCFSQFYFVQKSCINLGIAYLFQKKSSKYCKKMLIFKKPQLYHFKNSVYSSLTLL